MEEKKYAYQMGGSLYGNAGISSSGFIPTYVPEPIAEFKQAADELNQGYQQNIAAADRIQLLTESLKAREIDNPDLQEALSSYRKELEDMAKAGDYENMLPRIAGLARRFTGDQTLKNIQEYYTAEEADKKRIQGLQDNGKTIILQNTTPQKAINRDSKTGAIAGYNRFNSSGEVRLDWDEKAQEIWKDINPDTILSDPKYGDEVAKALTGFIQTGSVTGISEDKIKGKAGQIKNALLRYQQSGEYDQQVRYYTEMAKSDPSIDPELKAREHLLSVGMMKVFSQESVGHMQDYLAKMAVEADIKAAEDAAGAAGPGAGIDIPFDRATAERIYKVTSQEYDIDDFVTRTRIPEGGGDKNRDIALSITTGSNPATTSDNSTDTYEGRKKSITPEQEKAFSSDIKAMGNLLNIPEEEMPEPFSTEGIALAREYKEFKKSQVINYKINSFDKEREYEERSGKGTDLTSEELRDRIKATMKAEVVYSQFYDVTLGKVFRGESSEFAPYAAAIDEGHFTVSGSLDPKHSYTQLKGLGEYSDAREIVVQVNGERKRFLVPRSEGSRNSKAGRAAKQLNTTYNRLYNNPGKSQQFTVGDKEVEVTYKPNLAKDEDGSTIIKGGYIYLTGGEPVSEEIRKDFPNGTMLINTDGSAIFTSIDLFNQHLAND